MPRAQHFCFRTVRTRLNAGALLCRGEEDLSDEERVVFGFDNSDGRFGELRSEQILLVSGGAVPPEGDGEVYGVFPAALHKQIFSATRPSYAGAVETGGDVATLGIIMAREAK